MKIKKADIILIIFLLALSLGLSFLLNMSSKSYEGDWLIVEQDGKVIERLPLEKDGEYIARYGGHYNKIEIKDGKAEIVEADCLDQICTHMQPISKEGETIICLPHRLFLEVESYGDDKDKEDSIDKVVR